VVALIYNSIVLILFRWIIVTEGDDRLLVNVRNFDMSTKPLVHVVAGTAISNHVHVVWTSAEQFRRREVFNLVIGWHCCIINV
jgi:hypothetical protein